jgi:hypothetical protein
MKPYYQDDAVQNTLAFFHNYAILMTWNKEKTIQGALLLGGHSQCQKSTRLKYPVRSRKHGGRSEANGKSGVSAFGAASNLNGLKQKRGGGIGGRSKLRLRFQKIFLRSNLGKGVSCEKKVSPFLTQKEGAGSGAFALLKREKKCLFQRQSICSTSTLLPENRSIKYVKRLPTGYGENPCFQGMITRAKTAEPEAEKDVPSCWKPTTSSRIRSSLISGLSLQTGGRYA